MDAAFNTHMAALATEIEDPNVVLLEANLNVEIREISPQAGFRQYARSGKRTYTFVVWDREIAS